MNISLQEQNNVRTVSGRMGKTMTEEQVAFANDFTKPLVSFSNPGTGKSFSIVVGLIVTQLFRGVPGSKINAMSFTNAATNELHRRYENACLMCGITPTVKFNTFHSICYSIVREVCSTMRVKGGIVWDTDLPALGKYLSEKGLDGDDMYWVKEVLETINSLNSALAFDRRNIELSYKFKCLGISADIMRQLRKDWFLHGFACNTITQGDIPIYALYILCKYPEVRNKYLSQYRVMVVDEFQDLSLLHLKILSMITNNLVAIGDMKQQIYGFNGASQQIVEEYLKIYPAARTVNLTQSFRCKEEISEFATQLIRRNDMSVIPFKGVATGAKVRVVSRKELDLKRLVEKIGKEQEKLSSVADRGSYKDSLFLFRNNASAIPVAEELYKQGVRFQMPKFLPIFEMPIFKEVCILAEAARYPQDVGKVHEALHLLPEFRKYNVYSNPVCQVIERERCGLFDVKYRFRTDAAVCAVKAMLRAARLMEQGASAGRVFNVLLEVYGEYVIENKWWRLPRKKEYYYDLIGSIVSGKTYDVLIAEEYDKLKFNDDAIKANFGVRCYTVHAAKGLEADNVYLLDADEGVFPNITQMKKYIAKGCDYEAAKELRNERNLLYVAVTRAKDSCTICYNAEISKLISEPLVNELCYLDGIYDAIDKDFDDVKEFMRIMNVRQSEEVVLQEELPAV